MHGVKETRKTSLLLNPISIKRIKVIVEITFHVSDIHLVGELAEEIDNRLRSRIYTNEITSIKVDPSKVTIQIECPEYIVDFILDVLKVFKKKYPIISIKKIFDLPNEVENDCTNSKVTLIKDKNCKVIFENHLKNGEPVIAELGKVLFALYTFIIARPQGIEIKKEAINLEFLM